MVANRAAFVSSTRLNRKTKVHESLAELLHLRLLILSLGEKPYFNWWSTMFLGKTSEAFLLPIFPRTLRLGQYHAVKEAAQRVHDEHIGVGRVFHLFRLPEEIEQDLFALLQGSVSNDFPLVENQADGMEKLALLAGKKRVALEGPVCVGEFSRPLPKDQIAGVAALYLQGFESGTRIYPYFVEKA